MKLARMPDVPRSQHGHRIEGDVQLSVRSRLPLPIPQGFPTAQGERPRPRIGPPSQMRGHLVWRRMDWLSSPKASAARPALSYALAAAVHRSRAAELGDELRKPLQAPREASRAKPRWIFAATFLRLQPVSPIFGSNVSQLVTAAGNSAGARLKRGALLQDLPRPERTPGHHQITTQTEGRTAKQWHRTRGDSLH